MSDNHNTNELSIVEAGLELEELDVALDILKARKSGLEAQIEHALVKGEFSPHYQLDRVKSRTRWQEGVEEQVIEIGRMLGLDLAKPLEAITPAQAKKLKLDSKIIEQFSYTPVGEVKLIKLRNFKNLFGE